MAAGTRYVSKERLLAAMLDYEYKLLVDRLNPARGKDTRFLSLPTPLRPAIIRAPTNSTGGWGSLPNRAQRPTEPVLLHINLRDSTAQLQQQAIGILGVNLVYAAFHQRSDAVSFLTGLFDELSIAHIEIDMIEFDGSRLPTKTHARGVWCYCAARWPMQSSSIRRERLKSPQACGSGRCL